MSVKTQIAAEYGQRIGTGAYTLDGESEAYKMKRYKVWVCLDATFDGDEAIEAETEEEAFIRASNMAMAGCSWEWDVEEIEDEGEAE